MNVYIIGKFIKKNIKYVIIFFVFVLSSCNKNTTASKTALFFDTIVTITLYGTGDTKILNEAIELCYKYETLFSRTLEGSDIYKINAANGEEVLVSPETAEILSIAKEYYELSSGYFDITVGGVSELWDFHSGHIPNAAELQEAVKHIGSGNLLIEGNKARLLDKKTKLDLGAIAKGYIADKIAEFLRGKNVSAVIDLGGNILTVGKKPNGEKWTIGIQKPWAENGKMLAKTKLDEMSVVTSGIYERHFINDGILYYHIFDTETGYPFQSDIVSVTVFSEKSVDGDALSTVVFCLGAEPGMEYVESLLGVEAVIITTSEKILYSSGIGVTIPIEWVDSNL